LVPTGHINLKKEEACKCIPVELKSTCSEELRVSAGAPRMTEHL